MKYRVLELRFDEQEYGGEWHARCLFGKYVIFRSPDYKSYNAMLVTDSYIASQSFDSTLLGAIKFCQDDFKDRMSDAMRYVELEE